MATSLDKPSSFEQPITRRQFLETALGVSALGWGWAQARPDDQPVRIGYIPITDASPLLIAHALGYYREEGLTVEQPVLFRAWSQIVEAFQARQVNVVHLLMPTAVWLRYARRFPAKIVAWNHVNGSAFTVRSGIRKVTDLAGQTVAVPFWYSIHNVVLQALLRKAGLEPVLGGSGKLRPNQVRLIVMPPPDMAPALVSGQIAGFIVAEPFNALAELSGHGEIFRFTGDVWKDHACCVVVVHEDDLEKRREWVAAVVRAVVRAQLWMRQNRLESAKILSREGKGYLPHPEAVLRRVLSADLTDYVSKGIVKNPDWGNVRIDFQPYPYPSYTEELVRMLRATKVEGETGFLQTLKPEFAARDLVDDTFVRQALRRFGGPRAFGQPDNLRRREVIRI